MTAETKNENPLSENEQNVLKAFADYWAEKGYGPSYRAIAEKLGMHKNGNGVFGIVNRLIDRGLMTRDSERETGKAAKGTVRVVGQIINGVKVQPNVNSITRDGVSVGITGQDVVFMLFDDGKMLASGLHTVEEVTNWCDQFKIPADQGLIDRVFQLGVKHRAKMLAKQAS